MRKPNVYFLWLLILVLVLAACSPSSQAQKDMMETETSSDVMMDEKPTDSMMEGDDKESMQDETPSAAHGMMDATGTPDMMGVPDTGSMQDSKDDKMMDTPAAGSADDTMMKTPGADPMDKSSDMMAPDWFSTEFRDVLSGETFTIADFQGKVVLVETFAQWCPTCLRQLREVRAFRETLNMPDDLVVIAIDIDLNEDEAMLKEYLEKHGFDWRFTVAPEAAAREIGDLYGAQFLNPPSTPMLVIDRHGEVTPLPFGVKTVEDLQQTIKPMLDEGM